MTKGRKNESTGSTQLTRTNDNSKTFCGELNTKSEVKGRLDVRFEGSCFNSAFPKLKHQFTLCSLKASERAGFLLRC
ncbi:MAG: hypothetical protein DKT66_13425 [Candidatus Melainabacteria bacterium]|nr:MAG: hypothetical protein DKT66_13425 [Candidatus Melainabacteria bacterium]